MKEYRLGDIITIKHGYAFDGEHIVQEDNGIVLVTPGNFRIGGGFQEEKCKFYSGEIPDGYVLSSGDFIVTMTDLSKTIDTLGYSALVPESDNRVYLHNQRIGLVSFKANDCFPGYIYFLMRTHPYQRFIANTSTGSTVHHTSPSKIYDYRFYAPSYEEQREIAERMFAYEKIIKNNQRQIKLLEEAAQRLYKEWFVDLRFPGHENTKITDGVPEGWTRCALGDLIDFNPKVSLSKERKKQSVPMSALSTSSMTLDMAEVYTTESNAGSKFQNGDTLLARITPCLENGKTAFVAGIEAQEGAVGSTEFIVMRSRRLNPYMVYLLARTDDFRNSAINSMTGSDGRQRAQVDKLQALPYLEPPREIIDTFEKNIAPLFLQIRRKNEMNWHLREARDLLLPKLMSGEIEL